MAEPYDSRPETLAHIARVRHLLAEVGLDLMGRAERHDASKLEDPEKSMFDEYTPALRELEYGSLEYKRALKAMGPALQHHYEHNDHHPEHHGSPGVYSMNLIQLIEMLADWKAAGERHADGGDLRRSIIQNAERFKYDDWMTNLLLRTAAYLGWI